MWVSDRLTCLPPPMGDMSEPAAVIASGSRDEHCRSARRPTPHCHLPTSVIQEGAGLELPVVRLIHPFATSAPEVTDGPE